MNSGLTFTFHHETVYISFAAIAELIFLPAVGLAIVVLLVWCLVRFTRVS